MVYDALGAFAPVVLNTSAGASAAAFFTTAPSSITLAPGVSSSYQVGGGKAPYTAVSNNTAVVNAVSSGNIVTLSAVSSGTATINLLDNSGATLTLTITVSSSSLSTTAGSAVTIANGSSGTYQITGGSAPYSVVSDNEGAARAVVSGSSVIITSAAVGSATITVRDAAGASTAITATIGVGSGAAPLFVTANPTVTLAISEVAKYSVGGGIAPYSASSSNTADATASLSGSALTVTGKSSGTATIAIYDAAGTLVTISVTVP